MTDRGICRGMACACVHMSAHPSLGTLGQPAHKWTYHEMCRLKLCSMFRMTTKMHSQENLQLFSCFSLTFFLAVTQEQIEFTRSLTSAKE